jgi:hypothetical protein
LFTLEPIFQGECEGLQIFEYFIAMGTPSKSFLDSFPVMPSSIKKKINNLKQMERNDLRQLIDPNRIYDVRHI